MSGIAVRSGLKGSCRRSRSGRMPASRSASRVMGAQLLVSAGEVLLGHPIKIAKRRRQAVAAVLFRHAAQRPQRILQTFCERPKTLATEHHLRMPETAEPHPAGVEPAIDRPP